MSQEDRPHLLEVKEVLGTGSYVSRNELAPINAHRLLVHMRLVFENSAVTKLSYCTRSCREYKVSSNTFWKETVLLVRCLLRLVDLLPSTRREMY